LFQLQVFAGQTVGRIEARDDDIGSNADVIYGLERDSGSDSELFTVDPVSGLLSANINLRPGENSSSYSLIVTASNPGQGHHTAQAHYLITRSVLRIVIDRPISPFGHRGRPTFVFTGHSMVAIIVVGAVSAVVIVVLLVAIAIVLCRQRRRTKESVCSTHYDTPATDNSHDSAHRQYNGVKQPIPPVSMESAIPADNAVRVTTTSNAANDVIASRSHDTTTCKKWKPSGKSRDVDVSIIQSTWFSKYHHRLSWNC
jgi:Cadherin domain